MGGVPSREVPESIFSLRYGSHEVCLVPLLRRYFNEDNKDLSRQFVELRNDPSIRYNFMRSPDYPMTELPPANYTAEDLEKLLTVIEKDSFDKNADFMEAGDPAHVEYLKRKYGKYGSGDSACNANPAHRDDDDPVHPTSSCGAVGMGGVSDLFAAPCSAAVASNPASPTEGAFLSIAGELGNEVSGSGSRWHPTDLTEENTSVGLFPSNSMEARSGCLSAHSTVSNFTDEKVMSPPALHHLRHPSDSTGAQDEEQTQLSESLRLCSGDLCQSETMDTTTADSTAGPYSDFELLQDQCEYLHSAEDCVRLDHVKDLLRPETFSEEDLNLWRRYKRAMRPVPCAVLFVYVNGREETDCFQFHGRRVNVIGYFGCRTYEDERDDDVPFLQARKAILKAAGDRTLERVTTLSAKFFIEQFCTVMNCTQSVNKSKATDEFLRRYQHMPLVVTTQWNNYPTLKFLYDCSVFSWTVDELGVMANVPLFSTYKRINGERGVVVHIAGSLLCRLWQWHIHPLRVSVARISWTQFTLEDQAQQRDQAIAKWVSANPAYKFFLGGPKTTRVFLRHLGKLHKEIVRARETSQENSLWAPEQECSRDVKIYRIFFSPLCGPFLTTVKVAKGTEGAKKRGAHHSSHHSPSGGSRRPAGGGNRQSRSVFGSVGTPSRSDTRSLSVLGSSPSSPFTTTLQCGSVSFMKPGPSSCYLVAADDGVLPGVAPPGGANFLPSHPSQDPRALLGCPIPMTAPLLGQPPLGVTMMMLPPGHNVPLASPLAAPPSGIPMTQQQPVPHDFNPQNFCGAALPFSAPPQMKTAAAAPPHPFPSLPNTSYMMFPGGRMALATSLMHPVPQQQPPPQPISVGPFDPSRISTQSIPQQMLFSQEAAGLPLRSQPMVGTAQGSCFVACW